MSLICYAVSNCTAKMVLLLSKMLTKYFLCSEIGVVQLMG